MMRALRLLRDQSGSLAVFWMVGMLGFFGFIAIVADTGFITAERRGLQNAADAAVLAGAQALPWDNGGAAADAQAWAAKNVSGLTRNQANIGGALPGALWTEITVIVERNAAGLFNGDLSLGRPNVRAVATAMIRTKTLPGPGAAPLGIEASTYFSVDVQNGDPTTLILAPPGSNSGLLNIDGPGASALRDALVYGSSQALEPTAETETGQNVGPVLDGLEIRLQAALGNGCFTWDQVNASAADPDWPCGPLQSSWYDANQVQASSVVLIPVIVQDFTDGNGQTTVDVYSTASGLYLTAYFWVDAEATFTDPLNGDWSCASGPPSKCEVQGRFMFDMPSALASINPDDQLIDFDPDGAVRVVQLVN